MRIILFAGKGGVGKTSVASATGVTASRLGYKTLILSLDIAHNLSDVFSLGEGLLDNHKGAPVRVEKNLWIQEIDIQEEIRTHWGEVHQYLTKLFNATGMDEVQAEEFAVLPGMEEVIYLMHINQRARENDFDLLILDCAPTGESLRFISIPTTLDWYINKIYRIQRRVVGFVRPVAERLLDIPLPGDAYFTTLENLFRKVKGADKLLTDPRITTVRLVTNPERVVLKETQRAFLYFSLYKMSIDAVIMNRMFPAQTEETFLGAWKQYQAQILKSAEEYFAPVPLLTVDLLDSEPLGSKSLNDLGCAIYGRRDPTERFFREAPYEFQRQGGQFVIKVRLPFLTREEVELTRVPGEVIIRIGAFKRHLPVPAQAASYKDVTARMEAGCLHIAFGGPNENKNRSHR
jgi:arsenite-transporting ATPase